VFDEMMGTGAVITGRRTFDFAQGWAGDHHDKVPIFVLTHAAPDEPAPGSAGLTDDGNPAVHDHVPGRLRHRAAGQRRRPDGHRRVPRRAASAT
jgi:hypothetical protein